MTSPVASQCFRLSLESELRFEQEFLWPVTNWHSQILRPALWQCLPNLRGTWSTAPCWLSIKNSALYSLQSCLHWDLFFPPLALPLPSHVHHITAAHLHDNAIQKHYRCFCLTGLYLMPRNFKSIFKGVGGSKCGEIDRPQRRTEEVKTLALKI